MAVEIWNLSRFMAAAGELERVSPWYEIGQERIDLFAEATEDHQFIHVDHDKTIRDTPFTGTIAHGFLSLSMISSMITKCFPTIDQTAMSINYGFEKLRFLNTVPSGCRIRGKFKLAQCVVRKPGEVLSIYDVVVEIENEEKPALVAQWLGLYILKEG